VAAAAAAAIASSAGIATVEADTSKTKPPLLRSRTLPAIIVPGINILQAQIEARYGKGRKFSALFMHHFHFSISHFIFPSPSF